MAQRAARNADGKTYYVPADMTYKEWKKAFVDGDEFELNHFEKDDKILLKNNISKQNDKIEELKKQFSDETDGYSYDEWFKDFSSIEEGYGDVSSGDESFEKLKKLD